MSVFSVQDIGDVDNKRGLTLWWFDIYIGTSTSTNYDKAIHFGKVAPY